MANIYQKQGHYDQVLEIYKSVLELMIKIRECGQDSPDVAVSFNNLAAVYLRQGNHVQAKEMATMAYDIFLKVLGPDHPNSLALQAFIDEQ
jgi:tetratricopeptide (TPR) repeat protein